MIMSKQFLDDNWKIIHEGYLKKSPPLNSKSIFNLITKFNCSKARVNAPRRWRKRYFVLIKSKYQSSSQYKLLYFRSKSATEDNKSLGCVDITQMVTMNMDVDDKIGRPNTLSISTKDHKSRDRIYYLSAETNELMVAWSNQIRIAVIEMTSGSPDGDDNDDFVSSTLPKYPKSNPAQSKLNHLTRSSSSSIVRTHTPHLPLMSSPGQQANRPIKSLDKIYPMLGRSSLDNGGMSNPSSYYNLSNNNTAGFRCSMSNNSNNCLPPHLGELPPLPSNGDYFEDNLQEPLCIVDDVYRLPTDIEQDPVIPTSHAYINLNDSNNPIQQQQSNSDIYFNHSSIASPTTNTKPANNYPASDATNYFFPSPSMDVSRQLSNNSNMQQQQQEYQNFSCLDAASAAAPSPIERQRHNSGEDFNFPLPTRIRNSSGDSTSTSSSSSENSVNSGDVYNSIRPLSTGATAALVGATRQPDLPPRKSPPGLAAVAATTTIDGDGDREDHFDIEYDDIQDIDNNASIFSESASKAPPQVPRRVVPLSISTVSQSSSPSVVRFSSNAVVHRNSPSMIIPTKPAKSTSLLINTRVNNYDNNSNDLCNEFQLNYIENTCLSFNNSYAHNDAHNLSDIGASANHTPSPTSSSLVFKNDPFQAHTASSASTPIDDKVRMELSITSSTTTPINNNNASSVEYKEINVTGTEAFQKLKNKIQNK